MMSSMVHRLGLLAVWSYGVEAIDY